MNYRQAIDYLLSLVDHERQTPALPRQKRIYDLGRMTALLESLGNPHWAVPTIHIAGTKGKGSTAAMVDAVLSAAGYRTGFYSSPHLHTFRERIRRDTKPIGESQFAGLVGQLRPAAERVGEDADLGPVSLFEFLTGMAFQDFAQDRVDFQTIEVGLGGRLDATNVVAPAVCAITAISLDHMAILGDTVGQIAADKAGIIKAGAPVVVAPQSPEAMAPILAACREKAAPVIRGGIDVTWQGGAVDRDGQELTVQGRRGGYNLRIPLLGQHQQENAAVAVAILETLAEQGYTIPESAMAAGMAQVHWPGRLEVLSRRPLVVADGAHNVYSTAALLDALPQCFDYRRLILIAGFSRDKSVAGMVELMAAVNPTVIAARSRHPRSLPPAAIADLFGRNGVDGAPERDTVAAAYKLAQELAGPEDLIVAAGSLFVAAELREAALGIEAELYPDLLPADLRAG